MSTSPWPSIEEQLEAAQVVPGSALETLIRENQEFHMLAPNEAAGETAIPLWLRVYYRKRHPSMRVYPRALTALYAWMVRHQDLPSGQPEADENPPATTDPVGPAGPEPKE